MAATAYASGTQTCTVTTEHFLSSPNVAGVYTLNLDTNALAAGDILEVRLYKMVLTGGTARVAYVDAYAGAQPTDDKIKISVPLATGLSETNGLRFSITQTAGTGRNIPWSLETY